jgi:Trypsin-like peptidase domain
MSIPIRNSDLATLCCYATFFFFPANFEAVTKDLKSPPCFCITRNLTLNHFLEFLQLKKISHTLPRQKVLHLLSSMVQKGYLFQYVDPLTNHVVYVSPNSIPHTLPLLVSELMPPEFLFDFYKPFIIQLIGATEARNPIPTVGTGILITPNLILTCAHVVNDSKLEDFQLILSKPTKIISTHIHQTIDVAFLCLAPDTYLPRLHGTRFKDPLICESLFVLGYPPIPLNSTSTLVMQKGEVTVESIPIHYSPTSNESNFLFSATVRPGNSGGPIINTKGELLGIVSSDRTSLSSTVSSTVAPVLPFYAGIPAKDILRAHAELAIDTPLPNCSLGTCTVI